MLLDFDRQLHAVLRGDVQDDAPRLFGVPRPVHLAARRW